MLIQWNWKNVSKFTKWTWGWGGEEGEMSFTSSLQVIHTIPEVAKLQWVSMWYKKCNSNISEGGQLWRKLHFFQQLDGCWTCRQMHALITLCSLHSWILQCEVPVWVTRTVFAQKENRLGSPSFSCCKLCHALETVQCLRWGGGGFE